MSWINLGEVCYVIQRERGEAEAARTVGDLRHVLDVRLPDSSLVLDAARIKAVCPMAYADAFAAALTARIRGELWTGDPELLVSNARWRWRDLR
jgi:predicted nucleic acid-binding protein